MKSIIAVSMLFLALSLCNLTGRRSANNSNTNTSAVSTSPESTPAEDSNTQVEERREIDSRPSEPKSQNPITSRNSNVAAPPVKLDEPPPPPKKGFTPAPPKTISGGVLNGKAISLPKPAYPAIAKAAHASGNVMVQVTIDENGNVISAHPISGHPLLQSAATAAARQAKFSPTRLSGEPVKVTGVITYNFVAQ